MLSQKKLIWYYLLAISFIAVNSFALFFEIYWLNALPIIILFVGIALFKLDKLLLIITFFTPLSINLEEYLDSIGLGLFVPTEPLIFGVLILTIYRFLYKSEFDFNIVKHPVSIAIIVNMTWIFIASIASQSPLISFKFFLSRLWFIVAFYFLAIHLFKEIKNINRFIWMYVFGLTIVIFYTVIQHSFYGFADKPAHWVMQPFYKDHTSYGAVIALFYPFIIASFFSSKYTLNTKILIGFLFVVFTIGLILSYTRAAWVSLVFSAGIGVVFWLKIKFRTVFLMGVATLVMGFVFQDQILMKLQKNKQDSSEDLAEHVQSISNVASDASNLERLNRWACVFRMFKEKPIFGWGPGTYAFYYAPFQHSSDLTIISTNFGNKGNAHSEYFGPLAESGILGSLTFIALIIIVIYKASYLIIQTKDKELKLQIGVILLGLITYFVHGMLNNYLDTDKIAVPFWGLIAALVAIELYHKDKTEVVKKPSRIEEV